MLGSTGALLLPASLARARPVARRPRRPRRDQQRASAPTKEAGFSLPEQRIEARCSTCSIGSRRAERRRGSDRLLRRPAGLTDPATTGPDRGFLAEVAGSTRLASAIRSAAPAARSATTAPSPSPGSQLEERDGAVRATAPRPRPSRTLADAAGSEVDGLEIELGGELFVNFEPPQSETLGLAAAVFILLLAFGSVLAVGLPIGVALARHRLRCRPDRHRRPPPRHARLHHRPSPS